MRLENGHILGTLGVTRDLGEFRVILRCPLRLVDGRGHRLHEGESLLDGLAVHMERRSVLAEFGEEHDVTGNALHREDEVAVDGEAAELQFEGLEEGGDGGAVGAKLVEPLT